MRESFAFDAHYAQCVVEDNAERFAMDTFGMGRVVIDPHTFFMAMYANEVSLVGIYDLGGGTRVARLTGALDCATEAGTATGTVGSRTATEPAFYDIEATDGGHGGGAAGDSFAFTVYFDPQAGAGQSRHLRTGVHLHRRADRRGGDDRTGGGVAGGAGTTSGRDAGGLTDEPGRQESHER